MISLIETEKEEMNHEKTFIMCADRDYLARHSGLFLGYLAFS
jgi:hypothetical protein